MRAAALAAGAALVLLIGLSGCGSGDDEDKTGSSGSTGGVVDVSGTDPVGQELAGSVTALVTCEDWNGADEDERIATIDDIRRTLAPQTTAIEGPELTDEEAAEVFDNSCRPGYAAGFRLYKLYAQAVGFVTLKRAAEAAEGD